MQVLKSSIVHPLSFKKFRRGRSMFNTPYYNNDFLLGYDPLKTNDLFSHKSPPEGLVKAKKSYGLKIPVPGFHKNEITICIENDVMTIAGSHKEASATDDTFLLYKFEKKSFEKNFHLSPLVDEDNISARLYNGVLNISLPTVSSEPYVGAVRHVLIKG